MGLFSVITKPIGCLMSFIGFCVIAIIVVIVLIFASFQYLLPTAIESGIQETSNFPAHINDNDTSLLGTKIAFKDFSINNPSNFSTSDFVLFKELTLDVDAWSSNNEKLVFDEIVIDIARFNWIENKYGKSNVQQFTHKLKKQTDASKTSDTSKTPTTDKEPSSPSAPIGLLIKKLTFRLGTVSIQHKGKEAKAFEINYDKTFTNVTDLELVANRINADLSAQGITIFKELLLDSLLKNDNLKNLNESLNNSTTPAINSGKKAVDEMQEKLKSLF